MTNAKTIRAAAAGDAPAHLTTAERKTLAAALARAAEAGDAIESATVSFGRWLLVEVFADDTQATLVERIDNPVWSELRARAGGPSMRMSEKTLYVALYIAVYDKRINSEAWRNLDAGRKELLLPLRDEALLRAAAKHVTDFKLSQRDTEAYVASVRSEQGTPREQRVTPGRFASEVKRFRSRMTAKTFERRLVEVLKTGDPKVRDAAVREIEAVRNWADRVMRRLKG